MYRILSTGNKNEISIYYLFKVATRFSIIYLGIT